MGDDNWDIGAVVRSCNANRPNNIIDPNLGMETSENDDMSYLNELLADDINNFDGLSEMFSIEFPVAHQEKLDDQVIITNQNDNQQLYLSPIQKSQFSQQISFPPPPPTITYVPKTTTTPQEWIDLQQQINLGANVYPNISFPSRTPLIQTSTRKNQPATMLHEVFPGNLIDDTLTWQKYGQNHFKGSPFSEQISFPPASTSITCVPQTTTKPQECIDLNQQTEIGTHIYPNITFSSRIPLIKTSIRKNQSARMLHQLLPEELTDDTWKWQKCGQKHIKGSPFPRNYFKCSTSTHCQAKKTIEKSPKDEDAFLVSYSGEHNHDPPMKRTYLIGCNKSSKFKIPKSINVVPRELSLNTSSSASKRAKRSRSEASPSSPTMPMLEIKSKNKMVVLAVENKGHGEEE